jgi:hypothetical protein
VAKTTHPLALTLRVWAGKLERNLLTASEADSIATLLRRIAAGESLDEIFGVRRAANRPNKDATHHYVEQVYGMTLPTYDGKPGVTVTDAISQVALASNVSFATVKTAYYSKDGRSHREQIIEALKDPLT